MMKVNFTILTFMLVVSNLFGQTGNDLIGDPYLTGSIYGGNHQMACGEPVTLHFTAGLGVFCGTVKWNVLYPNGYVGKYSGNSIELTTGSTIGSMVITAVTKKCSNNKQYRAADIIHVSKFAATPTKLHGNDYLCNSATASYTSEAVYGASNYTFNVPSGWKINGLAVPSLTTTSRTVSITAPSSGSSTGQIRVRANRNTSCGLANSAYKTKMVKYGKQYPSIFASASTVSTSSFVTLNASGIGLSNFAWSLPSGWGSGPSLNQSELIAISSRTPGTYLVSVSAQSCGVTTTSQIEITVTRGNSFYSAQPSDEVIPSKALITNELSVYPNPAVDRLQLTVPENINLVSVSIIDISNGKQVLFKKVAGDKSTIDISNIQEGIYIVNMNTLRGERIQKRIKVAH